MNDIQRAYVLNVLQTAAAQPCNLLIEDEDTEARGRWLIINLARMTTTVLPPQEPSPPSEHSEP